MRSGRLSRTGWPADFGHEKWGWGRAVKEDVLTSIKFLAVMERLKWGEIWQQMVIADIQDHRRRLPPGLTTDEPHIQLVGEITR